MLVGDATKAREKLGWKPRYTIDDLIAEMMEYDISMESNIKSLNLQNLATIQEILIQTANICWINRSFKNVKTTR